jgi:hypothetical protein
MTSAKDGHWVVAAWCSSCSCRTATVVLGLDQISHLGYSFGGPVAYTYAAPRPVNTVEEAEQALREVIPHATGAALGQFVRAGLRQQADGRWSRRWDPKLLEANPCPIRGVHVEDAAECGLPDARGARCERWFGPRHPLRLPPT